MQNAEFLILNPQLTLLCRLFLLAARQSVQAPSALAPQRRFSILNCQLSYYSLLQHCTGNLQETCDICTLNIVDVVALIARLNARLVDRLHNVV